MLLLARGGGGGGGGGGGAGAPPTVKPAVAVLLVVEHSAKRLTSFTNAVTVCAPATAVYVAEPVGPELAVSFTEAPGASAVELVSDQETPAPSTENATPMTVPAGVATPPTFVTRALNVTGAP